MIKDILKEIKLSRIARKVLGDKSKSKKAVTKKQYWVKAVEPEYLDVSEFKALLEQDGVTGVGLVVTKREGVECHARHVDNIFELVGGLSRLEAKINKDGMAASD